MKKKITALLFAASVLITSTACSENNAISTNEGGTTVSTTAGTTVEESTESSSSPLSDESLTFNETFDGVVLTITLNRSVYKQGDVINITTSVKNETSETIGLLMPHTDSDSNTDITLRITNNELKSSYSYARLTDIDTFGMCFDDGMGIVHIEAGEEYTKVQRFETYYVNYDILDVQDFANDEAFLEVARTLAPVGKYHGTANIAVLRDAPYNCDSGTTAHLLAFNFTIE